MEYIVNKTPVRTSNNFKVNDFKVDLDIIESEFNDFIISEEINIKKTIKNNIQTKIGLPSNKYLNLDIYTEKSNPIVITYDFENSSLVSQLNINVEKNNNYIIIFKSDKEVFLNTKIVINSKKNSLSNISIVNLLEKESKSFISIENNIEENAKSIVNYYSVINGENGENYFNSLYLGTKDDKLDLNYYMGNNNKNTIGKINTVGALLDNSYKSFKGTIDFYEGSSKSIGEENENCILLSDTATSRSLPMLLCHEEDVVGAHGVSTGKIDEDKLFYLMSRGITKEDSKRLIVNANYNIIIDNIADEEIKEIIRKEINNRI